MFAPTGNNSSLKSVNDRSAFVQQSLAITLREFYTSLFGQVRQTLEDLNAERDRCETLTGSPGVLCWSRYRAQIIFIISDLIDSFRNRVSEPPLCAPTIPQCQLCSKIHNVRQCPHQSERFEEYSITLLEQYYRCREADDDLSEAIDQLIEEMKKDIALFAVPLNDIQCATELRDQVVAIYDEFTGNLYARFVAIRTIRRSCQLQTGEAAVNACWLRFNIEILFGLTDTIRDVQARRENFNRVTLELLEAYYTCRVQ